MGAGLSGSGLGSGFGCEPIEVGIFALSIAEHSGGVFLLGQETAT
jgi:hypothetical protein